MKLDTCFNPYLNISLEALWYVELAKDTTNGTAGSPSQPLRFSVILSPERAGSTSVGTEYRVRTARLLLENNSNIIIIVVSVTEIVTAIRDVVIEICNCNMYIERFCCNSNSNRLGFFCVVIVIVIYSW